MPFLLVIPAGDLLLSLPLLVLLHPAPKNVPSANHVCHTFFHQQTTKTPHRTPKKSNPRALSGVKKSTKKIWLLSLLHPLHHPSQRVLIHSRHRIPAHLLDPPRDSPILQRKPIPSRSLKQIPQPDLLRRNLQLRTAMRPFPLNNQPGLMQQQKHPPHHHRALAQRLRNRRRRVHRIRLTRQNRQHPHTQLKPLALCHAQKATTQTHTPIRINPCNPRSPCHTPTM